MENPILATSDDGQIIYTRLIEKFLENACTVIQHTIYKGNVSSSIGVAQDPEALSELNQISIDTAKDGLSIVAIDKNTNKVVGIALNKITLKSETFFADYLKTFKNEKSQKIIKFLVNADGAYDLYTECQTDTLLEILFLGVLTDYRRKGIAKKLFELSLDIGQNLKNGKTVPISLKGEESKIKHLPKAMYGVFTSFISQRIAEQLCFTVVYEKNLIDEREEKEQQNKKSIKNIKIAYKIL